MKISIITVNLNGNRFLAESIGSVLSQTYQDFELLIIDGGSSDGSLATIQAAAERDGRVSWISEPDRGISDAMNKGIGMSTGEFVGVLHSDDRYPNPSILASVAAHLSKHKEADWLTGGIDFINTSGEVFKRIPVRNYHYSRLVRSNILFHPATFVRTETLRNRGMFDVELMLAMDYDLWLRLGALGDPVLVNFSVACFRVHDESISTKGADQALCEEFAIRQRYLKEKGCWIWPYTLHSQLKRVSNVFFMRRLRGQAQEVKSDV